MSEMEARIDAIEQRANAATPGPWEAFDENDDSAHSLWSVANDAYFNPSADEDVPWIGAHVRVGHRSDAEFIAHARQDVPWLIERLEAMTARAYSASKVADDRGDVVHRVRVLLDSLGEFADNHATHSADCHTWHPECLAIKLRRAIDGGAS